MDTINTIFSKDSDLTAQDFIYDYGNLAKALLDKFNGDLGKAMDAMENYCGEEGDDFFLIEADGVKHIFKR